jgi:hypothetical protein
MKNKYAASVVAAVVCGRAAIKRDVCEKNYRQCLCKLTMWNTEKARSGR